MRIGVIVSTATSYYVQERKMLALDCEGDMGRHYSTILLRLPERNRLP
uniref:Uncharacterized protein n=1 Tax=mine drainage metagenome TaxID=410659 RepID=E6QLF2_9ZZZZ